MITPKIMFQCNSISNHWKVCMAPFSVFDQLPKIEANGQFYTFTKSVSLAQQAGKH